MGREIEIKIPLTEEQFDKIFSVISGSEQLAGVQVESGGLKHIYKSDSYFSRYQTREESKAAGEPQVIRIRSEKLVEDGNFSESSKSSEPAQSADISKCAANAALASAKSYFCIKRKSIENGIELNREDETFVENPDVVRDLLLFSGYHQFFEKDKDAYGVYCKSDVLAGCSFHLELEIVNGLKYIEVEVTDETVSAGEDGGAGNGTMLSADAVRSGLEKFMEQFGLDTAKRDSRSWMEILRGCAK